MAKPFVFLIPGFLGSEIVRTLPLGFTRQLWINHIYLATGGTRALALSANGISPLDHYLGDSIQPGKPLAEATGQAALRLAGDFNVQLLGYDWRKSLRLTAETLYDQILRTTNGADYRILAHSMGGLIARLIWRRARIAGADGRIQRIITCGTPHWGSYSAVQLLGHISQSYQQIALLADIDAKLPLLFLVPGLGIAALLTSFDRLDIVTGSWPAVYDLMPSLQEPAYALYDPQRPALFQLPTWNGINRSFSLPHANAAVNFTQVELLDAIPPPAIHLDVIALGFPTAQSLHGSPLALQSPSGFTYAAGDGTVPETSATLSTNRYFVYRQHHDILNHPQLLSDLPSLLLDGPPEPEQRFVGPFGTSPPLGPGPAALTLTVQPSTSTIELREVREMADKVHDC